MSKARTLASTVSTGAVLADGVVNASEVTGTLGIAYTTTKTANYTAVANDGVLTNTTAGAFTVTLPASPANGAQVIVADAAGTWGTNNLTVARNGNNIADVAQDLVCDISGASVQFVYNSSGTASWEVYAQVGGNGGTVVTLDATQTLTNKTLTAPTINGITGVLDINTGTAIASAATVNLNTATGNRVHITGTTAITAVTLTRGPRTVIFDGILTLTHNATTNNLPSAANITTAAGDRAIYESDGTTVYCVAYIRANGTSIVAAGAGDHAVSVNTGSGFGSTNTRIRRFTTTRINLGTAITYADSSTLGASFTINEAGIYAVNYVERTEGTGAKFGVSLNSTELTTGITDIAVADILTVQDAPSDNRYYSCACVFYAAATNVVRPHTNATSFSTSGSSSFSIRKVGNV